MGLSLEKLTPFSLFSYIYQSPVLQIIIYIFSRLESYNMWQHCYFAPNTSESFSSLGDSLYCRMQWEEYLQFDSLMHNRPNQWQRKKITCVAYTVKKLKVFNMHDMETHNRGGKCWCWHNILSKLPALLFIVCFWPPWWEMTSVRRNQTVHDGWTRKNRELGTSWLAFEIFILWKVNRN